MLYYYLEGLDKKGPYSVDELKARNVNEETMVFSDGMTNWTAIKNLPDLSDKIFNPTIVESVISSVEPETITDVAQPQITESEQSVAAQKKKKIIIPAFLFLIIGIIAACGFSYLHVKNQRENDLEVMNKKINEVLQGKDEVCDYEKTGVTGELKKADWSTPSDNEGKELVEYYDCKSGGFTILTLTRKPNGYDIIENNSKNMGYKVPGSKWTPGTNYGYGFSTSGYSTPTYRQSIQTAYNGAMEYLSSEKENKSYLAGSYDRIKAFDEIKSDYFYINNIEPTKYSSASNLTKSWSGTGYVYNSDWIVWHSYDGKHFEIIEDKKMFIKQFVMYSLIGSILALLIYLLIRYRRRIALEVT